MGSFGWKEWEYGDGDGKEEREWDGDRNREGGLRM